MTNLKAKEAALVRRLSEYGSAVIAFSGGVDSSVLLAAAARALPRDKVLAVSARSATYPAAELRLARRIARQLKVRHHVIDTREFANPCFVANPPGRCYHCKSELFSELRAIARKEGQPRTPRTPGTAPLFRSGKGGSPHEAEKGTVPVVLDGTNYDDRGDIRPGRKAAKECGVKSPLLEARLTKPDLRALARKYGLPNWDKPAAACLASRIPYGTRLEKPLLRKVDAAERVLARLGFSQIRVRHHDNIARIEIAPEEFGRITKPAIARRVVQGLQKLGYRYATLDLNGYRTGSMNPKRAEQRAKSKEQRAE